MSNIVARYNNFVKQCVNDVSLWDLHAPSSNYVDQSSPADRVDDTENSGAAKEESSASTKDENEEEALEEPEGLEEETAFGTEQVEQEDLFQSGNTAIEEVTTSESTSSSGFLTGLGTGACVTAVIAISAVLYHKKSSHNKGPQGGNDKKGLYTSIELT